MNNNYSQKITQILQYSKEEAIRLNNDYIGPEHIMLGILRDGESKAIDVLRDKCHLDLPAIKNRLESRLRRDVDGSAFNYASKDIALQNLSFS